MTKKQCGWLLCAGPLIGLVTLPMALTAATFPLPIPTRPTSFPLNRASALGRPVLWGSQTAVPANASNLVEIAAGENHTIGLRPDGLVVVWGNNTFGEMNVPPSLSNVVSVAAGGRHCAALTADGKVVAWGFNDNGQSVVPAGLSNVVAIAAGYQQTLALRQDGSLSVWGIQKTVPANLTNVVAIAAGLSYSLALRDDGTVTAWGSQTVVPAGLGGVVALAAGYGHVVALRQDGNLFSWGNNDGGQTNVPPGALNEVAVAAGEFHTLALKQDGTVLAWGNNSKGQTNVPAGLSSAVAIAAGRSHSAALERIGPPVASITPANPAAPVGTTATLTAAVGGIGPIEYQWFFEEQPISFATNRILILPNVGLADAGGYRVAVWGVTGSSTSAVVTLAVGFAPTVAESPVSQLSFPGFPVALSVRAGGTGPFTFQWRKNASPLPAATGSNLLFGAVQSSDQGPYDVVVGSRFGAVTSSVAQLTLLSFDSVLDVAGLTWRMNGNAPWVPQTLTTYDGVSAARSGPIGDSQHSALEATVIGPANVSFWWRVSCEKDYDFLRFRIDETEFTNLTGKTDWQPVQFHLGPGSHLLQWDYLKDGSDWAGLDAAFLDRVVAVLAPTVVVNPVDQSVVAGTSLRLSATVVSGTPPFQYQWFFGGVPLDGATGPVLDLGAVDLPDTGDYTVRVSNPAGEATSTNAHLEVLRDPIISSSPQHRTLQAGDTAVFSVAATGAILPVETRRPADSRRHQRHPDPDQRSTRSGPASTPCRSSAPWPASKAQGRFWP